MRARVGKGLHIALGASLLRKTLKLSVGLPKKYVYADSAVNIRIS